MNVSLVSTAWMVLGVSLACGCSSSTLPTPSASPGIAAPLTSGATGVVVGVPKAPPAITPEADAPSPISVESPTLALRAPSQIVSGQPIKLTVVNQGTTDFRIDHPGGSSGCDVARWLVSAHDARAGKFFDASQAPGRLCTAVMMRPTSIVIAPGASVDLEFDTGRGFVSERTMRLSPSVDVIRSSELPPGEYDFVVSDGNVSASARVRLVKG